MGLLTDFFIATPLELASLDDEQLPAQVLRGEQFKGVDQVKLARLDTALTGVEFSVAIGAIDLVRQVSDEGPWTTTVREDVTRRLAELADGDVDGVAERWLNTEEMRLDRWTLPDARFVIERLRGLASDALGGDRRMFHWVCL